MQIAGHVTTGALCNPLIARQEASATRVARTREVVALL